jgi:hypothetical protein
MPGHADVEAMYLSVKVHWLVEILKKLGYVEIQAPAENADEAF